MPKLYSSREVVQVLQKKGFVYISQKGSHAKFRKERGPTLTVIVPANRKEIPYGTFRSILRQVNLSEEEFAKALK
ncbi:MAG TPA: type II toxin-antitoxin system HicA family toxin [Candidatus Paceibacterota bacterium]